MISASPPATRDVSRSRPQHAAVFARTAAFVCALVAAAALGACSQAPAPGSGKPVDQTLSLTSGQSYTLDDGAKLKFANVVNDSRCPVGVTCMWAGTATILLQLRPAGTKEDLDVLVVLPGGASAEDPASLIPADTLGYRVTLSRLEPAPTAAHAGGATAAQARATLHVEKPAAP